jgi:archaeal preflagellin peptidase FlaK
VTDWASDLTGAQVAVLLAGFAYAAYADLRVREVSDHLWQGMGLLGLVLGGLAYGGAGPLPLFLWVLVGVLVLEHLAAWDSHLPAAWQEQADRIEFGAYGVAIVIVAAAAVRYGVGPSAVPLAVIAVLATVLLSRLLFEFGALYGGADAKALMIAGLLVPLFPQPLIGSSVELVVTLRVIPFSITLLTDAAVLSLAVPICLALLNLARGQFTLARGFTGYSLPVAELPHRFVWVRDPDVEPDPAAEDAETSEEDAEIRRRTAAKLADRGMTRVWVSPQLPFLVLMTCGTVAAILAGNLILDLIGLA